MSSGGIFTSYITILLPYPWSKCCSRTGPDDIFKENLLLYFNTGKAEEGLIPFTEYSLKLQWLNENIGPEYMVRIHCDS